MGLGVVAYKILRALVIRASREWVRVWTRISRGNAVTTTVSLVDLVETVQNQDVGKNEHAE